MLEELNKYYLKNNDLDVDPKYTTANGENLLG
jgi:hypothetical protein